MTIVAEHSIGRVRQEEGERNGDRSDRYKQISNFHVLIILFLNFLLQYCYKYYSIFGSKFVYTVYEDPRGNALTPKNIENLARLHKMVMTLKSSIIIHS
uniref:Uncharacterized protein n=1 Tax=Heterorhabditis bacteriophora TaxID=37862 RepID=A0A1I7WP71_HETBA